MIVASETDKKALGKGIVYKNSTKIDKIKRKDPFENNIMFLPGQHPYAIALVRSSRS